MRYLDKQPIISLKKGFFAFFVTIFLSFLPFIMFERDPGR
jgi:hypothetical protein